jgi:hypothetical protein
MSGDCPDILCLEYDDLKTYAEKDLLEDLTPYLENSGIELASGVTDGYTFNGKISAVPPIVRLRAFVCRSEDIECAELLSSWTLEEMIEYVKNHPDQKIFDVGASKMLEYCLTFNQSRFIDWENYACSFESEEFYELLEFCNLYVGGDDNINSYPAINIVNHNALLYEVRITDPSDYIVLQQILKDENISFFGFPTDTGSGILMEESKGSYAISSTSGNKDIAWSFIESLITQVPQYGALTVSNGYPTDLNTRTIYFNESMTNPYIAAADENGNLIEDENGEHVKTRNFIRSENFYGETYYYYIPFEDELVPISSLLDNAQLTNGDSTILDIILENAEDYFSGIKSVEEVARQIQSRVSIYINERK